MLSLVNVSKTYRMKNAIEVKALDHVSVDFQEKGMIFILGKSGSGKSTMLNIIGGLDKADEGEIIIKGKSSQDFKGHDYDSYRNTFIGFVFQEYNLLEDFTIGKNIALALELQGKKATKEAIHDILSQVDMAGYEHRRVNQISGGQKQRVAIARALIKSPEIILADEPTGALDSVTGRQVFEILQKLSKEKLVIVVSHDRETAEIYGDRIIEMKDGQIHSDTSKNFTTGNEVRKGVFVNKNVILLEDDHKLDQADIALIHQMQVDNDDIILTKNRKRVDSFTFNKTEHEKLTLQTYNGANLKFISSKLMNIDSLKIGASGLKHKRVRLFFTILLSFIAIAFFALTDTLSAFKASDAHARTLAENNIRNFNVQQVIKSDDSLFGYYSNVNFSDENIKALQEKYPKLGISPVTNANYFFVFDPTTMGNMKEGDIVLSDIVRQVTKRYLYVNDNYFAKTDYNFIAGGLSTNGKDIVISSFLLDVYTRLSFPYIDYDPVTDNYFYDYIKPADFGDTIVARANQVIGKAIFYDDPDIKISGVINTPYDASLIEQDALKLIMNDYNKRESLRETLEYSNIMSFYVHEKGLENLHYSDSSYADEYYTTNIFLLNQDTESWSYGSHIAMNIPEDKLYNDRLIRFKEGPLVGNEIILSYHAFIDYDYTQSIMSLTYEDNYINLTLDFGNETKSFANITELMTWAENPSNLAKLKKVFIDDAGSYSLHNQARSYDYNEDYTLAGIYFPSNVISITEDGDVLYFTERMEASISVSKEKHNEFPLSLVSELAVTNNDDDLLNSYLSLFNYKKGDLSLQILSQYSSFFSGFGGLIEGLTIVFIVLGSILAVFSALLMMNFIATSIAYKKRDIGILRGLGARKLDVVKIFTFEALIIASINAVLAIAITLPSVVLINQQIIKTLNGNIVILAFTIRQLGLIIVIAVVSALLASIFPVLGIARKKPIDAINNR